MDDLFPDAPTDNGPRARHGAIWWAGAWQCRNWHGWLQSRENARGNWRFQIVGFGDTDASVYYINSRGDLQTCIVPMDRNARLLIEGHRWGRDHWAH